jgi:hypothetical protein
MKSQEAWKTIQSNLPKLVDFALTIPKGTWVDVFCDPAGKTLSFSQPSGAASVKLCGVSAPDLAGHYDLHQQGDSFIYEDGSGDQEKIPSDKLSAYLAQRILDMARDGGAEWGWEFKVADE